MIRVPEEIIERDIDRAVAASKRADGGGDDASVKRLMTTLVMMDFAKKITETGYEIFHSSNFVEYLVMQLVGGSPSPSRRSPYDCILADGRRIEVKFSRAVHGTKWNTDYFKWTNLRGINNKKIGNVDLLVLAGWAYGKWMFWVVPFESIPNKTVEMQVSDRSRGFSYHKIDKFFVGDERDLWRYFQ